jgi:hypothetical protein
MPWYLIFFFPGITGFFASQIDVKSKIDIIIIFAMLAACAYSLWECNALHSDSLPDSDEINEFISNNGEKSGIIITRLGESIANTAYDTEAFEMASTENGFYDYDNNRWQGVKDKVVIEDNLKGLIYDYNNVTFYPKPLNLLNYSERYDPPIARTLKEGNEPFDLIIAQEEYAETIKTFAVDYTEVYVTKSGEFHCFERIK